MKSAPEISHRTKSLATAIIIGLVGIGLLVFLSMSGLSGPRDTELVLSMVRASSAKRAPIDLSF